MKKPNGKGIQPNKRTLREPERKANKDDQKWLRSPHAKSKKRGEANPIERSGRHPRVLKKRARKVRPISSSQGETKTGNPVRGPKGPSQEREEYTEDVIGDLTVKNLSERKGTKGGVRGGNSDKEESETKRDWKGEMTAEEKNKIGSNNQSRESHQGGITSHGRSEETICNTKWTRMRLFERIDGIKAGSG